jgi:hypothetical protein
LINNAIRLLLTTGLYLWPFKEWDRLLPATQMWIALHALIQELFQCQLTAMAPTAGHQGYAPALPYQQNSFRALANNADTDDNSIETVATQVATLTYQSQLKASTAAGSSQHHEIQLAHLAALQNMMHENMHQLITGLNAVAFNISNKGQGVGHFTGRGNYGGGYGGRSCRRGRPGPQGHSFPPTRTYCGFLSPGGFAGRCFPGLPPGTQPPPTSILQGCSPQPYCAPSLPWMRTPGLGPAPFAHCIFSNNCSQTRLNAMPTGTFVTRVVLMWQMAS